MLDKNSDFWRNFPAHFTTVLNSVKVDVFDEEFFEAKITDTLPEGFENVYKLKNYCTIYLSFIKGWGKYYKRPGLAEVPIWIEIQLVRPLKLLDHILREMSIPSVKVEVV